MTVSECTSACGAAGYSLAGVEYASKSSSVVSILKDLIADQFFQVNAIATTTLLQAHPMSRCKSAICLVTAIQVSSVALETT